MGGDDRVRLGKLQQRCLLCCIIVHVAISPALTHSEYLSKMTLSLSRVLTSPFEVYETAKQFTCVDYVHCLSMAAYLVRLRFPS